MALPRHLSLHKDYLAATHLQKRISEFLQPTSRSSRLLPWNHLRFNPVEVGAMDLVQPTTRLSFAEVNGKGHGDGGRH